MICLVKRNCIHMQIDFFIEIILFSILRSLKNICRFQGQFKVKSNNNKADSISFKRYLRILLKCLYHELLLLPRFWTAPKRDSCLHLAAILLNVSAFNKGSYLTKTKRKGWYKSLKGQVTRQVKVSVSKFRKRKKKQKRRKKEATC